MSNDFIQVLFYKKFSEISKTNKEIDWCFFIKYFIPKKLEEKCNKKLQNLLNSRVKSVIKQTIESLYDWIIKFNRYNNRKRNISSFNTMTKIKYT